MRRRSFSRSRPSRGRGRVPTRRASSRRRSFGRRRGVAPLRIGYRV